MARPSQRKADLVLAAQRAMSEHGPSVRLNQIAEAAGVTPSAVLYHFPNMDELLLQANRAGMERFYNQRLQALDGISDPAERLLITIKSGIPISREDEGVRLLCALGGEAARSPMFAVLLTSLYDRQVGMYQSILELGAAQGTFNLNAPALTIARNLVALEDAYGYRIMADHPVLDYDESLSMILAYARVSTQHPLLESHH